MRTRTIMRIAIAPETEERHAVVYALCDDGTLWMIFEPHNRKQQWELIKDVPQEHIPDDER